MLKIDFPESDVKELEYLRFHHPHPKVQKRCHILWMRSQDFNRSDISKMTGVSLPTYSRCIKLYVDKGIKGLLTFNYPKHRSKLYDHSTEIIEYLKKNPPSTIPQASSIIEKLTGIKRSEKQVRLFLKNQGFKFRKVGVIPAKADVDKQKEFVNKKLMPRIEEAQRKERAVFFVDAAHFVMGAFLGYLWSCSRLFVKSSSGRKRFNVLGAIEVVNKKFVKVVNDSYINAHSVCDLLQEIASLNLGIPITLIMDNARYQHCLLVKECALSLDIELLFLPPYSPNLNLIERLWKFVKKKCLYAHYYEDFDAFKQGINNCLNKTQNEYKKDIDSLMTPKFQMFENVNILGQ